MALHYKSKTLAFTLWELMIAMLITSLIVSLSYGVYRKSTKVLDQDIKHSEFMHEIRMLERDLYRLTLSSITVTQEGEDLYFNFIDGYSFLEFSDSTMTIFMDELSIGREFPIEGWSAEYLNDRSEHIRSFKINCKVNLQRYTFSFTKIYPKLFLYSMNGL